MSTSSPPPAAPPGPAHDAGSSKRWWILGGACGCAVLVLLLAAVAAGSVWFFALRPTPEDTARTYLDSYVEQDCAAYEASTTKSFRDRRTEGYSCETWLAGLREHPVTYEDEIGDIVVEGNEASVRVSERIHDGDTTYEGVYDLEMIKHDGQWLVDDLTSIKEYEEV